MSAADREQVETRVVVLFGIIKQLMDTRTDKLFAGLEITRSQFSLLVHFSHNPARSWTVSRLAEVMEMNQPGITKTVKKLADKKLLEIIPDEDDSRVKHIRMTKTGLRYLRKTSGIFRPDIHEMFEEWRDDELDQLQSLLEKHKNWLDSNRLP